MRHPVLAAHPRRSARQWLNLLIGLLMMLAMIWGVESIVLALQAAVDRLLYKSWETPWQDIPLGLVGATLCFGFCWLAGEVVGWLNRRDAN